MKILVVQATIEHARALAPVLRAEDTAECVAAGYDSALAALEAGVTNSTEAWAIYFDGELGVVLGVDGITDQSEALLWCLTGEVIERAKLSYWRVSKGIVRDLRLRYRRLYNLTDARYGRALSWLKRLGFTVSPSALPHPVTGLPFHLVTIGGL